MGHRVDVATLWSYQMTHRMCGAHGKGEDKQIDAVISWSTVAYRVTDHGKQLYLGSNLWTAVQTYNEI